MKCGSSPNDALPSLLSIMDGDKSPALRVYAIQVLARFGDPSARYQLIGLIDHPDWPTRAMAYWFLSRYGSFDDYTMIMSRLSVEQNPFVQSEIALAAIRLEPF